MALAITPEVIPMHTVDPEDLQRAESDYNSALATLNKCQPGKPGFGAEKAFADAYQVLVRMGVKPQIKLRYRVGI